MPFNSDQIAQICKQYLDGSTYLAIAKARGVCGETIRRILKSRMTMRKSRETLAAPIDNNYFETISTSEKAYWLGFLAADGCIAKSVGLRRSIRFWLSAKDVVALRQFAADLKYGGKIHRSKRNQFGICFNNPKMCEDLVNFGFLDWKQGDPRMLSVIPKEMVHHFVRGFFDGDGCISHNRSKKTPQFYAHFCANKKDYRILEAIGQVISENAQVAKKSVKFRKTCSVILWNGNRQVGRIGAWMYTDATRKLERKYVRFTAATGGLSIFSNWQDIHNWTCSITPTDINRNLPGDAEKIVVSVASRVMSSWVPPKWSEGELKKDLADLMSMNVSNRIEGDSIRAGRNYGNAIITHFQPLIWSTRQQGHVAFSEMVSARSLVVRATRALLTTGDKIYPERLVRELQFAGLSRASLLGTPTILAVIRYFGLSGFWLDPCAGWGNRLLAAHASGLKYVGIDPAKHFAGLLAIKEHLRSTCILINSKFQDCDVPSADFVLTSPPFYDKEDYGLGPTLESFEEWYRSCISKIANLPVPRIVLHVDNRICDRLEKDFELKKVKYVTGNQHKAPQEWFVEIGKAKHEETPEGQVRESQVREAPSQGADCEERASCSETVSL